MVHRAVHSPHAPRLAFLLRPALPSGDAGLAAAWGGDTGAQTEGAGPGTEAVQEVSALMPERIQLSRTKGWRKPEGTIVVARPSKWGNPYGRRRAGAVLTPAERQEAVEAYRWYVLGNAFLMADLTELRGRDLACWCPIDQPCHADVLLEMANR